MWWSNHTSRNIDIEAGVKMAWTGLNLTNDGRRILNKAQLNNRLNFKSIVIGDGNAPANFNAQKKLVHQLYELTKLKISIEDDVCLLMTDLPVVDYDYYLREIGVIVTTDDGDKLYAYDNCGGDAQYVINTAGIERTEKRVRLALTVSGVENITVSVPSNLYVDYKDYENTIADIRQSKIDVVGGDISDTVSSFKQKDILENIKSGEKTGQIFGKVSKAINVLISHLADNVRHITADERSLWNTVKNKVNIIPGKGLSTNDYTTVEKNKLSGIADKANNYVHPASHPADMITQDATHRFVSDDEKKVWNTNKSNVDTHVSNNTIHITSQERTNWNDANNKKHSHSNKSVLDGITSALINTWNKVTDKLDKTGDVSNTTTSFSTASTRSNIATGEKLSISLGKIAKFFTDLKIVAFTGSYTDLSNKPTSLPANGGNSATVNGHAVNADVPANAKFTDNNTTYGVATQSANGLLSASDKKKLDGIAAGANAYSHPTSAGNKHIPSGGSSGQILRWSADGTAVWGSDNNTWRGIQNNLTSDSTTDSLSAAQGKVLKGIVDDLHTKNETITMPTETGVISGYYRKVTLDDGTKILSGFSSEFSVNFNKVYGSAYYTDVSIPLPQHMNYFHSVNVTPFATSTGLPNVMINGYTGTQLDLRIGNPKSETTKMRVHITIVGKE